MAGLDDARPDDVGAACHRILRDELDVDDAATYLLDFGNRWLLPFSSSVEPRPMTADIQDLLSRGQPHRDAAGTLVVPLIARGQYLGALELTEASAEIEEIAPSLGIAYAQGLVAASRISDVITEARGGADLNLAATMQYQLLPIPDYGDDRLEIGARIEPAYDIAGDAFDYAINQDTVELAVFDAVGHGVRAAMLTSLAVAAYRHARMRENDLSLIAGAIDQAVAGQGSGSEFVTGILGEWDLVNNDFTLVVAGHLPPLIRRPGEPARPLTVRPDLPFGLGGPHAVAPVDLEVGDMVLCHSDGVTEVASGTGERWGDHRLRAAIDAMPSDISVGAMCAGVLAHVLAHRAGPLADDATIIGFRRR